MSYSIPPQASVAVPLKISIVTVCYNSAATITRTLQSVAAQNWPAIEHIVVDGASTDATMSIINAHRSSLAAVMSEPDRGVYDAMNKGVALATGDVIVFLNADDYYIDNEVISRVATAMQAEQLDALYGDVAFFRAGESGKLVRRYNSGQFRPTRIASGWMPAHPALFVRRELFDRFGLFRTDYRIAGDFEFVARAFKDGRLRYRHIPRILVNMRLGGASTSGWKSFALLNSEVIRACRENGIRTSWARIMMKYPLKILEFIRP